MYIGSVALQLRKEDEKMFSTFGGFFAAYIPLVILAIIGVWHEDKLIRFEQKLRRRARKKHNGR